METQPKLILPSIVTDYFEAINRKDFQRAADLFVISGALVAPLGKCVRGRASITEYLREQCDGMTLYPETAKNTQQDLLVVEGKVHCLAFKVNVRWTFHLIDDALGVVKVHLVDKLAQLSHLRNSQYAQF